MYLYRAFIRQAMWKNSTQVNNSAIRKLSIKTRNKHFTYPISFHMVWVNMGDRKYRWICPSSYILYNISFYSERSSNIGLVVWSLSITYLNLFFLYDVVWLFLIIIIKVTIEFNLGWIAWTLILRRFCYLWHSHYANICIDLLSCFPLNFKIVEAKFSCVLSNNTTDH